MTQKGFLIASPLNKYINARIGEIYMMMGKNGEARVRKNIVLMYDFLNFTEFSKKLNEFLNFLIYFFIETNIFSSPENLIKFNKENIYTYTKF